MLRIIATDNRVKCVPQSEKRRNRESKPNKIKKRKQNNKLSQSF